MDPKVVVASVLLLFIARTVYKKNQVTKRPPMVPYLVPWVGSAIDLGKSPDAFFRRAMYVECLFIILGARDELSLFSVQHMETYSRSSPLGGILPMSLPRM